MCYTFRLPGRRTIHDPIQWWCPAPGAGQVDLFDASTLMHPSLYSIMYPFRGSMFMLIFGFSVGQPTAQCFWQMQCRLPPDYRDLREARDFCRNEIRRENKKRAHVPFKFALPNQWLDCFWGVVERFRKQYEHVKTEKVGCCREGSVQGSKGDVMIRLNQGKTSNVFSQFWFYQHLCYHDLQHSRTQVS